MSTSVVGGSRKFLEISRLKKILEKSEKIPEKIVENPKIREKNWDFDLRISFFLDFSGEYSSK